MNEKQKATFEDAIDFVNRASKSEVPDLDMARGLVWDQSLWVDTEVMSEQILDTEDNWCGTSCCVAGYVVLNAMLEASANIGQEVDPDRHRSLSHNFAQDYAVGELGYTWSEVDELGEEIIGNVAAALMGLRMHEADDLFSGANGVERINMLAAEIRAQRAAEAEMAKRVNS